jgi:hypothetical protein
MRVPPAATKVSNSAYAVSSEHAPMPHSFRTSTSSMDVVEEVAAVEVVEVVEGAGGDDAGDEEDECGAQVAVEGSTGEEGREILENVMVPRASALTRRPLPPRRRVGMCAGIGGRSAIRDKYSHVGRHKQVARKERGGEGHSDCGWVWVGAV